MNGKGNKKKVTKEWRKNSFLVHPDLPFGHETMMKPDSSKANHEMRKSRNISAQHMHTFIAFNIGQIHLLNQD